MLPGIERLWAMSRGEPEIAIAVLDGPVDLAHPAFAGANLQRHSTLVNETARAEGAMSVHGTHVASLLFGRAGIQGLARGCRGIVLPIFPDGPRSPVLQLDIARAIEQALELGAHIINLSGGQRVAGGAADAELERAVRRCAEQNVLLVAAAGNDACSCLHVPAALPATLAVGALGRNGLPLPDSNWGPAYRANGVLASGESVVGARAGGGTVALSGSSFAAPLVSAVAALLLSVQRRSGASPNPRQVRDAILASAQPCPPQPSVPCDRFLHGVLDVAGALSLIVKPTGVVMSESVAIESSTASGPPALPPPASAAPSSLAALAPAASATASAASSGVRASACGCSDAPDAQNGLIYAIGSAGFDYGTDARRDTFRQLMPYYTPPNGGGPFPPNPYDPEQLVAYLRSKPEECTKLIWTLNLDLTPIYAIEAEPAYAEATYKLLRDALANQIVPAPVQGVPQSAPVSRVSLPGRLTGESVRLFSGQRVPIVRAQSRGFYEWNQASLVQLITAEMHLSEEQTEAFQASVNDVLSRIYYDYSNLGQTSADRALNYAATNGIQAAMVIAHGLKWTDGEGAPVFPQIARISTAKSRFCRMDSDCIDVKLSLFNPKNIQDSWLVSQFTVDVSDTLPVTVGLPRTWREPPGA